MERKLKIILVLAFLLRLLVLAQLLLSNPQAIYDPDSGGYTVMGKALVSGDLLMSGDEAKASSVFRVLGYPIFLSLFHFFGLNDIAVSFIQLLLDVASVWLIFSISKLLFKQAKTNKTKKTNNFEDTVAYATAFMYAISPLFLSFFFKILTESLFTFVFLLALYFFLQGKKYNSSLFFGLLILIKPIAIFYPLLFAAYNYFKTKDRKESLAILLIPLVIASFWLIRNYGVFNKVTYSGIPTLNYVCWNSVYLANDVGLDNPKWKDFIKEHRLETFEGCQRRPFDEIEAQVPEINRFVMSNIGLYALQYVKGAITFFAPTTPNNLLRALGMEEQAISLTYIYLQKGFDLGFVLGYVARNAGYAVILLFSVVYHLAVYGLFVMGLLRMKKEKNYAFMLLVLLLIGYNILATGPVANYRFRIPVEPLILLAAGYGAQPAIIQVRRKLR